MRLSHFATTFTITTFALAAAGPGCAHESSPTAAPAPATAGVTPAPESELVASGRRWTAAFFEGRTQANPVVSRAARDVAARSVHPRRPGPVHFSAACPGTWNVAS
jgi:hypothetical protein